MALPDKAQQTPLEQLREMNEQVGKSRKGSARARRKTGQNVEKYYRKQLQSIVQAIQKEIESEVIPAVKQEKSDYLQDADPVYTQDGWADRIIQLIRQIAEKWTSSAMQSEYDRIAKRTVSMAEAESTKAFLKSVNEAVGVDMSSMMTSEGIEDYVEAANYQNAQLIRTVPSEFLTRVENSVLGGIRDGDAPSKIARNIRESTNVTKNQAQRIARDQTTKLTSEITERRQRQSGIKYYQVITAGDERVTGKPGGKYPNAKISCWGIANQDIGYGKGVYRWDKGATWNGVSGLNPGQHHVQCRCTAKPIFEWELPKKS